MRGMPAGVMEFAGKIADLSRRVGALERATGHGALPLGILDYAEVIAVQPGIVGSVADITGLTVTWDADPTREYRLSGHIELASTNVLDVMVAYISTAAGGQLTRSTFPLMQVAGSLATTFPLEVYERGLTGPQTRKVQAIRAIGAGTGFMEAGAGRAAILMVEDVGLATS